MRIKQNRIKHSLFWNVDPHVAIALDYLSLK